MFTSNINNRTMQVTSSSSYSQLDPVCEKVELEDEVEDEISGEAVSFPSPMLNFTDPSTVRLGSSSREYSGCSLERREEVCFSIGANTEVVASQTEGVRGNLAVLDEGFTLLRDVYTHSNDATFKAKGREYYQPRFNLGDLMGAACSLSERLGYSYGGGAILISDDEKGPPTAAIALVKRGDYAKNTYNELASKWHLGEWREDVFPILAPLHPMLYPIHWWHMGKDWYLEKCGAQSGFKEQEMAWRNSLQEYISILCDADGIPLDSAIERIFIPTPEERRDIYGKSPEMIANADVIYFVYKAALKDADGKLIPPELIHPHGGMATGEVSNS